MSFLRIPKVDGREVEDPVIVAKLYLRNYFVPDLIAVMPYSRFKPNLIFLRLLKLYRMQEYKENFDNFIIDTSNYCFSAKTAKTILQVVSLII